MWVSYKKQWRNRKSTLLKNNIADIMSGHLKDIKNLLPPPPPMTFSIKKAEKLKYSVSFPFLQEVGISSSL